MSLRVVRPGVLSLLQLLGVRRLRDADVFATFLLPSFSALSPAQQSAQRAHILSSWPTLRQDDHFVSVLRGIAF